MIDGEIKAQFDRLWDESKRQNSRLNEHDEELKELRKISGSVEKLALNMESMLKEQTKQGERLDEIESKPAQAWDNMTRTIFTTIISAASTALAIGLFHLISTNM